jgi:hypothetical protein
LGTFVTQENLLFNFCSNVIAGILFLYDEGY